MSGLLHPSKILVENNAWLGYVLGKEPVCSEAKAMLEACCACDVELFYAPSTLKDVSGSACNETGGAG